MMLESKVSKRFALGLGTGLALIVACVVSYSDFYDLIGWRAAGGMILYFTMICGGFTALAGVFDSVSWWLRGAIVCAVTTSGVVLISYDYFATLISSFEGVGTEASTSPWALVVQAVIIGFITDFVCTKFAGEGKDLLA